MSTGTVFYKALAEAMIAKQASPEARVDLERICEFVDNKTGFRVTNKSLAKGAKFRIVIEGVVGE